MVRLGKNVAYYVNRGLGTTTTWLIGYNGERPSYCAHEKVVQLTSLTSNTNQTVFKAFTPKTISTALTFQQTKYLIANQHKHNIAKGH